MDFKKYYYFDNATTSYPKPIEVSETIKDFMDNVGGTYGRVDTLRGKYTTSKIEECRDALAAIIGTKRVDDIILSSGATRAINDIINGLDLAGGEILTTSLEHNSTLRPIHQLKLNGIIDYKIMPSLPNGTLDIKKIKPMINSKTKLAVINMGSNVSGLIQPIKEIKEALGDIPILLDVTQTAGTFDISADDLDIDLLAFTGHKGLLGPTGTGAFFVGNKNILKPSFFGGGFGDGIETPFSMPESFESGTPNTLGIIGLLAALENRPKWNIDINDFFDAVAEIKNMNKCKIVYGGEKGYQGFLFSIVPYNIDIATFTGKLYSDFNIECRHGLHCAFMAHDFYGNDNGAVRFSFSPYTTKKDLEYLIHSLGDTL